MSNDAEPQYPHIKSFTRRGGRLARKYEGVLAENADRFVIEVSDSEATDLASEFGRSAPLAIEIGPGSGEQLVAFAQAHPDWNVLAIEAWHPGIARCVSRISKAGIANARVIEGDAAELFPKLFGLDDCGCTKPEDPHAQMPRADMVWTFFPDPWRKARHHKRRLVNARFAKIVAGALREGGMWRLATDWDNYAWQMRDVVEESPYFSNTARGERPDENDREPTRGGFAPRWDDRLLTRFEQRGIEAGRTIHDVAVERNGVSVS